jgi:hypothetical protein
MLSARMAASDVYTHATGYDRWDMATHLEPSEDLGDWQRLDARRQVHLCSPIISIAQFDAYVDAE